MALFEVEFVNNFTYFGVICHVDCAHVGLIAEFHFAFSLQDSL